MTYDSMRSDTLGITAFLNCGQVLATCIACGTNKIKAAAQQRARCTQSCSPPDTATTTTEKPALRHAMPADRGAYEAIECAAMCVQHCVYTLIPRYAPLMDPLISSRTGFHEQKPASRCLLKQQCGLVAPKVIGSKRSIKQSCQQSLQPLPPRTRTECVYALLVAALTGTVPPAQQAGEDHSFIKSSTARTICRRLCTS
jgi:hypothetical protein